MTDSVKTISADQLATLQALIGNDNRVAFYLKLNEFTGSKTALLMAEISSSTSVVGGTAWAVNTAYQLALPGYPAEGVAGFSRLIAAADLKLIADNPSGDRYVVPDDQGMLLGAYGVWENGYSPVHLGYAFPGNGLIAANYLTAGDAPNAAKFAGYAALAAPALGTLFVGELLLEGIDSRLNSGKSIQEFLATNPGSTLQQSADGKVQAIIGADGKTIGAFVNNTIGNGLPLNVIGQVQGLISDALTKAYELWNSFIGTQGTTGNAIPMLDVMGNFTGFSAPSSAVVTNGRDPANTNYMIDTYENGATHRYAASTTVDGAILILGSSRETWTIPNGEGGNTILTMQESLNSTRVFGRTDLSVSGAVLRSDSYAPVFDSTDSAVGYTYQTNSGGVQRTAAKGPGGFQETAEGTNADHISFINVLAVDASGQAYLRQTTTLPNGNSTTLTTNPDGSLFQRSITTPDASGNTDTVVTNGAGLPVSRSHTDYFYDENGTSRLETVTTYPGGIPTTVRNAYDTDGQLTGSTAVDNPAAAQVLGQRSVTTLNDIAGLIGAIQGGRPLPILNSGLRLLNSVLNPAELAEKERSSRYEISSCLRNFHKGWRPISCMTSPERAANQADWRVVA